MFKFAFIATFAFLSTVAIADSLPVDDQEFGCIDASKARGYVSDFQIDLDSFGGMELCDGRVDTKKLFNDLQLVEQGHFSGNRRNLFIRNIIPTTQYFSWLKEQTAGVRRGHDLPTATAYNSYGYFTMQDGWAKLSTLGRVGTIIHEARHTEGYSHTQCRQGPYKDAALAGCDTSIAQTGSHGVEMEYYSRVVLQGDNFHPVYKQMARLMNLGRANFVFNTLPMEKREGLVAVADNQVVVVDSDLSAKANSANNLDGYRLKRTSFGATLYKDDQALAIDPYGSDEFARRDEFSYYKLLLDGRITNVADMQEVDIANRRYYVALTKAGALETYVYAEGHWSNPVQARDIVGLVTTTPKGQEGLFVVTNKGEVQALNPTTLRRGQTVDNWPADLVDVVNFKDTQLAVSTTGGVTDLNSGKSYSPLESYRVRQLVRAPFYNAYDLESDVE